MFYIAGDRFGVGMFLRFLVLRKVKHEVPMEKWAKSFPLQFKYFDELLKKKTLEVIYHPMGQQGLAC